MILSKKSNIRQNFNPHYFWVFIILSLFLQCKKEKESTIIEASDTIIDVIEQDFPIVYNAQLPEGKMPYPHHNPEISQSEYNSLVQDIFMINNFGLYQCGNEEEYCYFHDGLDFVLDNGTPIFSIEEGTVRAINNAGDPFFSSLVVEDTDESGFAWVYTHIYNFAIEVGDVVCQGQYLARVNFQGVEHIHLGRARLRSEGLWSNNGDIIYIFPDDYFTFIDDQEPVIKTPFHYFRNATDSILTTEGTVDTISGEVDIVVSMRDGGTYAREGSPYSFGDRLAVRDISYRILRNGIEILNRPSFDFRKLEFFFEYEEWRRMIIVFKYRSLLEEDINDYNRFFSHYIITNARDSLEGHIDTQDEAYCWNTLELDSLGQEKYPNGLYQIEVTAHDSNGNEAKETDEVYVRN